MPAVNPFAIVSPDMPIAAPAGAEVVLNIRLKLLPLIVTRVDSGPVMVTASLIAISPVVSVIVRSVLKKVGSKEMVSRPIRALASSTALTQGTGAAVVGVAHIGLILHRTDVRGAE